MHYQTRIEKKGSELKKLKTLSIKLSSELPGSHSKKGAQYTLSKEKKTGHREIELAMQV